MGKKWKLFLSVILTLTLIGSIWVLADDASEQDAAAEAEETEYVFTTEVGEIHIQLPDDGDTWAAIQDPSSWFAICDGKDLITVDYYSDQEPPEEEDVDDEHYEEVVREQFDLDEGSFVVTGYVTDKADMEAIRESVNSFQLLPAESYDISELDATGYCIADDGANVWAEPSTDADIIGEVAAGDSIPVVGVVELDETFSGWLCVDYNGQTGYVWGDFFSSIDPEADLDSPEDDAENESHEDYEYRFSLHNSGWYVARMRVTTQDNGGNVVDYFTDSVDIGQTKDVWVVIFEDGMDPFTYVYVQAWDFGWYDIGKDEYLDLDKNTSTLAGVVANCKGTLFNPSYVTEVVRKS